MYGRKEKKKKKGPGEEDSRKKGGKRSTKRPWRRVDRIASNENSPWQGEGKGEKEVQKWSVIHTFRKKQKRKKNSTLISTQGKRQKPPM